MINQARGNIYENIWDSADLTSNLQRLQRHGITWYYLGHVYHLKGLVMDFTIADLFFQLPATAWSRPHVVTEAWNLGEFQGNHPQPWPSFSLVSIGMLGCFHSYLIISINDTVHLCPRKIKIQDDSSQLG